MRPQVTTMLRAGLTCLCSSLLLMACSGGAKTYKNQYGAPSVGKPASAGAPKGFSVPADLLPPGAEPMKTDDGVSSRNYSVNKTPQDLRGFFEGALKGASIEATREGEKLTITGGGWVIQVISGGGEGENAVSTIVYAREKELK